MTSTKLHRSKLRQLLEAESRHHLLTALVVVGCTFAILSLWLKFSDRLILSWDVFALTSAPVRRTVSRWRVTASRIGLHKPGIREASDRRSWRSRW